MTFTYGRSDNRKCTRCVSMDKLRDQFETEKARLMQSMFELRTEKMRLEEELDIIKDADRDKAIQLRQVHDQHQREMVAMKRASALENRKQMEELRSIERKVMDKEKEISRKSKRLSQVEMSKEELQEKLNEQKLSERINLSMSMIDLNSSFSPRKTQEDREKGLTQRNAELSTRVKQLEDRITSLTSDNEDLVSQVKKPAPATTGTRARTTTRVVFSPNVTVLRQNRGAAAAAAGGAGSATGGRKRRISLSTICANLEEENQKLHQQITQLNKKLEDVENAAPVSMDDKALEEKLRVQEKEKLMIERTLAQLLVQNNIKLPKDVRSHFKENIENQALQMELNDALDTPNDSRLVDDLKNKVVTLEEDYQRLKAREAQLKQNNIQLGEELSAFKEYKTQLAAELNTTKSMMKSLSEENSRVKQESRGGVSSDRQEKEAHNLRNEIKMLREEKQRFLDGEASARQKIKLLEEVQMQLVKKEEKNSRYYDDVTQKLSLITKEKNELAKRVEEYEAQRRYEAEEMASMLNDRNDYLQQLEKNEPESTVEDQDKEYLRQECENYRLSNIQLEDRLLKMEAKISPDSSGLVARITELEEATEVVEALKAANEDLKNHIRQLDAEKTTVKKNHNEELQRVIRTLDKKNKEHNQKSEELRSHIKRLESDLRRLENSKMENSGNLQIKTQELQQMSEYVKKLEDSEKELRMKLEMYQKSTQEELDKLKERNRELELGTKKMTDMRQTERVLRRHIIEIDKSRASEARQHHRAKLQLEDIQKKLEASELQIERAKEVEPLIQFLFQEIVHLRVSSQRGRTEIARQNFEVVMLKASEKRLKDQVESMRNGKNVEDSIISESKSKDEELTKLYEQIKNLNLKLDISTRMEEENTTLREKMAAQEVEIKESRKFLKADVAKLEVQLQAREKEVVDNKAFISRLQNQVMQFSKKPNTRELLQQIVALEEELTAVKSENTKCHSQIENYSKSQSASIQSVELTDGMYSEIHSSVITKLKEQGEELSSLHKNLQNIVNMYFNQSMRDANKRKDDDSAQNGLIYMQSLDTMSFIVKENMSLEHTLFKMEQIYSRDLEKLNNEKKALQVQVEDLKASIVELKLTEVDNEFSNYPAALSMELRQLNNKLAMTEESNRSLKVEVVGLQEQLHIKSDKGILLETQLHDAEHKLASVSTRSHDIKQQSYTDQAEGRHKTVKHKLNREIELLESSLETAHATIKTLQSQLPGDSDTSNMVKQVQESHSQMSSMQAEYRKQIDNLDVSLSTQNTTLIRRENEIKMMREQISQLETRLERAAGLKEQDLLALKQDKDKYMINNEKLERQNIELVTLCETIKGDYEKQTGVINDLESTRMKLQHTLEYKEHELSNVNEKIRSQEEKILSLRDQISSCASPDSLLQSKDAQINDLEEKLNDQSEKFQTEISALKSDMWHIQTDLATEKANKKAVEANVSELKLKLDNCNSSYQRELERNREQLDGAKHQHTALNNKYQDVSSTADQLTKKVRQLEFEVESKTNEIRDLKEQCNELDKTLKQRNSEIERFISKTAALDKELSVRRNATDVNGELSDLLLNKDNHIQEIENKLKEATREVSTLKGNLETMKKKVQLLEQDRHRHSQETKLLQNANETENRREREVLREKNSSLNKEINRLSMLVSDNTNPNESVDNTMLERVRVMEAEYDQISMKYKQKSVLLEEKEDEIRLHKDEIKLLKMTIDSYDTRINEQTDLINKLQKELTNVKGTLAVSLLDEIQNATSPAPQIEKCPSIVLADDDVTNALRTIDEANNAKELQRSATAESEAKYYVALFDYDAPMRSGEVSLREGDIVIVLSEEVDGFYMAEVEGQRGLVPVNYVEEYTAKRPGPAIPLEAYRHSTVMENLDQDYISPPATPSAIWLPNSSVCLNWETPLLEDGKNHGIEVAGYKVYVASQEKTIVFGAGSKEIVLENMSSHSLQDISIVTLGIDKQESAHVPIALPKPPQKAEILKAVQAQSTSIDLGSQYVVALYTYDPQLDSPNEYPELELPFVEGDIIKKLGETMADGFFKGELYGNTGLIPSNFVQLILEGDSSMDSDLLPGHRVKKFVALYDYDPGTQSPNENPETELAFCEGDILNVTGPMDEDRYFPGEINGKFGLIPSNFVTEYKEGQDVRDTLPREDSTEAAIAMLLSEAAASAAKTDPPALNNVPASSELDVRNTLNVRTRWHQRYPNVY